MVYDTKRVYSLQDKQTSWKMWYYVVTVKSNIATCARGYYKYYRLLANPAQNLCLWLIWLPQTKSLLKKNVWACTAHIMHQCLYHHMLQLIAMCTKGFLLTSAKQCLSGPDNTHPPVEKLPFGTFSITWLWTSQTRLPDKISQISGSACATYTSNQCQWRVSHLHTYLQL